MTRGYPQETIERVLANIPRPTWVAGIGAAPKLDQDGELAIEVTVAVAPQNRAVLTDGAALTAFRNAVHDALLDAGVDLWPHTRFVEARGRRRLVKGV